MNSHDIIGDALALLFLVLFIVALVGLFHGFGADINELVRGSDA